MRPDRPGRNGAYRQQLPRPLNAEVVEPEAAFARLSPPGTARLIRWPAVERAFGAPEREPSPSLRLPGGGATVAAAVLLALVDSTAHDSPVPSDPAGGGEISLVLIRRAVHMRSNPGEIAFPGGRLEPGESPRQAALREASEEVGLDPGDVQVLGELPLAMRASRPEPIAAFVGAVAGTPVLIPNPAEVAELLVTPLLELADPSAYWEEVWHRTDGLAWRMSFFDRGEDLIWGASARILVTLLDRLAAEQG